ncbi:MAG: hypothetical protein ACI31R_04080 [Bacilli bacterium]
MRKVISGLFLLGTIVFLVIGIVSILDLGNIISIGGTEGLVHIGLEISINLFYIALSIICLIVSSSLYIVDTIKNKK